MKRIALWLTLFAVPCAAQSPLGRLDFRLQNAQGQAVPGASVNVYTQPSTTTSLTVSTVQVVHVGLTPAYYVLVTFTTNVPAYAAGQTYSFSGLTTYTALNGQTLPALPYAAGTVPPFAPAANQALFLFGSATAGPASDTGTGSAVNASACGSARGPAAQLYSAALNGTVLPQPLATNGFGEGRAYVTQGCYTVVYTSPYTGTLTYADQSAIAASNVTAAVGAGCSSGVCTIPQGGTNATTQAAAFASVVAPGGAFTGPVTSTSSILDNVTLPAGALVPGSTGAKAFYAPHGMLDVNLFGTSTAAVNQAVAVASAAGMGVYFPCGTYLNDGLGTVNLASNVRMHGDGHCSVLQAASPYSFNILSGSNISNVEIDGLRFESSSSAASTVPWTNMGIQIISDTEVIGNNANINIHDCEFNHFKSYAMYVWYTKGLYIRNNRFSDVYTAIQVYDNMNGWIENNYIPSTNTTDFVTMISVVSVSGLAPNGGHPTKAGLHNTKMHINNNTIGGYGAGEGNSFGEDILVHDCLNCEVSGNHSVNDRIGISVSVANNFNMVLDGIAITGNTCSGGEGGNPTPDGNACIVIGGDTQTNPVWVTGTTYTLPTQNTCTASPKTCVQPTTAATPAQQSIKWILSAVSSGTTCTSGGSEPAWPTWSPTYLNTALTVVDNDCTWTALGPWRATDVAITGNTSTHNGYQQLATGNPDYAFYAFGATDAVTFADNVATDCYGACFGIIGPFNSALRMNHNTARHVVTNAGGRGTGFNVLDKVSLATSATGSMTNNFVSDALTGYDWAITHGDASGLFALNNLWGNNVTTGIKAGGTAGLVPVTGTACTAGQYVNSNVAPTGTSTFSTLACAQVDLSQLSGLPVPTGSGGTGNTGITGVRMANGASQDTVATASQIAVNGIWHVVCSTTTTGDAICAHGSDSTIAGVTCGNNTDALNASPATFVATCSIPANYLTVNSSMGRHLKITAQFGNWTPATAPSMGALTLGYGSSGLWTIPSSLAYSAAVTNQSGQAVWEVTAGLQSGSTSALTASGSITLGQETVANSHNGTAQPQTITTNANANILIKVGWASTGISSGTYTSGGSITGSAGQTCTLATFNNGNSAGTATVALTGTNTISGGTALVITNTGVASTSAATSATLGSGTATCSGTAVVATVLGGAQGTAMNLQYLGVDSN